jgi:hypothetical protein
MCGERIYHGHQGTPSSLEQRVSDLTVIVQMVDADSLIPILNYQIFLEKLEKREATPLETGGRSGPRGGSNTGGGSNAGGSNAGGGGGNGGGRGDNSGGRGGNSGRAGGGRGRSLVKPRRNGWHGGGTRQTVERARGQRGGHSLRQPHPDDSVEYDLDPDSALIIGLFPCAMPAIYSVLREMQTALEVERVDRREVNIDRYLKVCTNLNIDCS